MKLPDHISPSFINSFSKCPRKYYYKVNEYRTIVVDDSGALFGSSVHSAIENYFDVISDDPMPVEIRDTAQKCFSDAGCFDLNKRRATKMLKNFVEYELKKSKRGYYKPTFVEKRLRAKIFPDVPDIVGIIDFYSQDKKMVVDWKTAKTMVYSESSDYIQGKVYELLMNKSGYPVNYTQFFYLSTGQNQTVPKITDESLHTKIKEIMHMIRNDDFPAQQSPLCNYCPYQLQCEYRGIPLWA